MDYKQKYELWLKNVKDEKLLDELKNMTDEQISTAFFKDIEFGTAGMRGTIGAGSNCMNIYNVAKVTKAICDYLKSNNKNKLAVSYDSRDMSYEFAILVAKICAQNGVYVYLANQMMPTPYLSYMVRFYGADMGVMITASHNPKEYNGYKVYGEDGCQLLDEPSLALSKIADEIDPFSVEEMDYDEAVKKGFVVLTDDEILESYCKEVKSQSLNKIKNLKVVFSALNGTGINVIPKVLEEQGASVVLNEVQCKADKNFTTCPSPNPANTEVYASSIEIAKNCGADIIIASDPDADRVGVEVLHNGEYAYLTGNEIGVMIADYLLSNKKVDNGVMVKSIVTTGLVDKLAAQKGVEVKNVLTGFKYIGEFILNLEKKNQSNRFMLGFEESSGYLVGTYVRDKDAVVASMIIAEMASRYKLEGRTIIDRLNEIYAEFGLYEHFVYSYKFPGEAGYKKMQKILAELRTSPKQSFGEIKVLSVTDYLDGVGDLPKANVLTYNLEQDTEVIVRPSGTEPLIKIYVTLSKNKEINASNLKIIKAEIDDMMK